MYTVVVHDHINGLTADVLQSQAQKQEALILANRIEWAMDRVLYDGNQLWYDGEELDS